MTAREGARAGDGAAALARWLESRAGIEGPGLFLPPGARGTLLTRLRMLGSAGAPAPSIAGSPGRVAPAGGRDLSPDARRASLARLADSGTAAEIESLDELDAVRAVAESCVRCPLHRSRRNVVFAEGSPDARVMCVGEAPGANEDETGLPFVGRAGQLLDRLLLSVGLPRQEVYICNVLKCRPPRNRNPEAAEIERCSPFLRRQVALVAPEVIVAFGTFAARTLLDARESLGRLRGRTHLYQGVPLVVTYHPAALLRNPGWTRPTWEDLQRVRRLLGAGEDERDG